MADDPKPPTPAPNPPTPDPPKPDPTPDPELGEAGKRAIAAERHARAEAERRIKELEPLAAKAKELEDASKSEAERAAERATGAEKRAVDAELRALRLEVAIDKGLTPAQAKRLVGATKEELESDADDLIATFGGGTESPGAGDGKNRRPKERLRPGSVPEAKPEETDPRKLAALVPRS